jgi:hypothetical protein
MMTMTRQLEFSYPAPDDALRVPIRIANVTLATLGFVMLILAMTVTVH